MESPFDQPPLFRYTAELYSRRSVNQNWVPSRNSIARSQRHSRLRAKKPHWQQPWRRGGGVMVFSWEWLVSALPKLSIFFAISQETVY